MAFSVSPVRSNVILEDQIVITMVTNGSNTAGLQLALIRELSMLTEESECQFTNVQRFGELTFLTAGQLVAQLISHSPSLSPLLPPSTDGCPEEEVTFNEEFEEFLTWPESEILQLRTIECPCGSLNASVHGSRILSRQCAGSYSFGAEWNEVEDGCGFTPNTFQLCNVTTVSRVLFRDFFSVG